MALIKRIVLFITTLFFIITLLIGATTGFAKEDSMGLGIGTTTCNDFIFQTVEMSDDGNLTKRALMSRLEYLQWVTGFMTALNIRHYEKNNRFKILDEVKKFNILYNKIVSACNFIEEDSGNNHFSIAAYVVFDSLDRKKDDEN